MSEFSDSYHLRRHDPREGVNLLKRTGLKGFVFPASNGWISLVVDGSELMPNDELIKVNYGTLVHFVNAEDHGWYFSIYNDSKQVCHYECMWSYDIEIDDSKLNYDVLMELIQSNNTERNIEKQDLEQILHPQSFEEIFEEPSSPSRIADLLGLENYQWVSFQYVAQDYYGDREIYPDLICVE